MQTQTTTILDRFIMQVMNNFLHALRGYRNQFNRQSWPYIRLDKLIRSLEQFKQRPFAYKVTVILSSFTAMCAVIMLGTRPLMYFLTGGSSMAIGALSFALVIIAMMLMRRMSRGFIARNVYPLLVILFCLWSEPNLVLFLKALLQAGISLLDKF